MTLQLSRKLFSVKEYYKMAEVGIIKPGDRVELIEGEIITMGPIKSRHAGTVNLLTRLLFEKLGRNASILVQNPLRLSFKSEPEPDLVIAKYRKDEYASNHPKPKDVLFIIEVADSSLPYDRKVKGPLYAQAGIPEYWIVNLPQNKIEKYTQPDGKGYLQKKVYGKRKTIVCGVIDFSLKISELFHNT